MTLDASFTVNSSGLVQAHASSYGATVNLALSSLSEVSTIAWSIAGTSHSSMVSPTITPAGSPTGATASFAMPADPGDGQGRSVVVKCLVTDSRGQTASAYRVVGVANAAGQIPIAAGEENYRSSTHGWAEVLNSAFSSVAGGVKYVRAVAASNITLSGTQTIDGVACVAGDRVLAAAQTTGADRGIYVVAAGAWSRAGDYDSSAEVTGSRLIVATEGTSFAGSTWQLATTGTITLGSTSLDYRLAQILPRVASFSSTNSSSALETVTALNYTIPEGYDVTVQFVATGDNGTEHSRYTRLAEYYRRVGGSAVAMVGTTAFKNPDTGTAPFENDAAWDAAITLSTNTLNFQVKQNAEATGAKWLCEVLIKATPIPT